MSEWLHPDQVIIDWDNYPFKIELTLDGSQYSALIGPDLAVGFCGFADTVPEALANLREDVNDAVRRGKISTETAARLLGDADATELYAASHAKLAG